MSKTLQIFIIALFLLSLSSLSIAQEGEGYSLNFKNNDLEVFIEFVAKATGKQILYDPSVRGRKIFLISTKPVAKNQLFAIFKSVMEYNGFILETVGKGSATLIKVKRNILGPWTPTMTIFTQQELEKYGSEDQFITMVIKLKYISAREVQTTLRALRIVNPQGGNLAGIEGSNTILVTDYAPNVKRIYEIIQLMDQQGPEKQLRLFKLKTANAEAVKELLKEFEVKQRRTSGIGLGPNLDEIKISADLRINAVIVQAYAAKMQKIANLITQLDQELEAEPSKFHIAKLKHADATKIAEELAAILEGGGGISQGKVNSSSGTSNANLASTEIVVQAETQTNSILVRASQRDWREILRIIEQIDIRRPQVLVEAAIIEISPQDVLGLGIEIFFAEATKNDKFNFGGGSNFGFSNLVAVDGNTGTPIGRGGDAVTGDRFGKVPVIPGAPFDRSGFAFGQYDDFFNLPVLLHAIQTQTDAKIVSLPHVVADDNEVATIKVADAQPRAVNRQNDAGDDFQTVDGFEEAGTTLTITPHISGEKNYLRLEIDQLVEAFDAASNAVGGVQAKTTRRLTTSITVPDGQTVAIGGLSFDSKTITLQKVPFLGDLPIVGFLFQTRVVDHNKQNIYLFVTPRILRDENFDDYIRASLEKKLDAQSYGMDIGMIDKSFIKYQEKYDIKQGQPEPKFMLQYHSPINGNGKTKGKK